MTNETDNHPEFELRIEIPNGVILTLIGILILLTPLFTPMTTGGLAMDLIAGGVLTLTGLVSLILGIVRTRTKDSTGRR